MWHTPATIDVALYLNEERNFQPDGQPFFVVQDFQVGNWSDVRRMSGYYDLPSRVQSSNGSLWAHLFVSKSLASPTEPGVPEMMDRSLHIRHQLTRFLPHRKDMTVKKLIGQTDTAKEAKQEKGEVISYFHPNLTFSVVGDAGTLVYSQIHPVIAPFVTLEPSNARDESGEDGWYLPIAYVNDFWLLRDHMFPINTTTPRVPIHFELSQTSLVKMQMMTAMDQSFKQQAKSMGGSGAEFEEIKRILLETNVWLLGMTIAVSCLHSLFEFLSFKNDIQFFRNKKDNTGISTWTILMNIIQQTVILLYLLDSSEETSMVLLIGQGFGILVEAWKLTTAVNVRLVRVNSLFPYRVKFEDKKVLNEAEQATKEYDAVASTWLLYASIPLLIAYATWSLLYQEHKSWWSFVVQSLVGFIYAYGFLTMLPSLYIDYKLKSVAHLSKRALTYKFLNSIVDDGFAFIIKQPLLARLACFRDDVVFLIFMYQTWIYKIDKTRSNEFGQVAESVAADNVKKNS
ncbi:cleft lip and palate transmembrane 1 [Protomyces lactucae-debilis]|uniref:Cleft lip and palate transmembrane 1 n=1 Tax=Protomyces lactucae-debilis TaxID=2754530 RepID=A0A1Y2FNJ4_PROLT|nr:cleft lip and palate transmembrane 1 [Protomyces lactucae-debilis]ORY85499.1 cleft lip and palate transmembrane 1 [Protomyces lactucae-debilis]